MFNISEIVRYKNCDHVVMNIKECSGEYILWNLDNVEEIKCKKEFVEKSPIETLDIFKDEWLEEKHPEDQYGNFYLQVSDFLVDTSDKINIEAIMKDHTYGKKYR